MKLGHELSKLRKESFSTCPQALHGNIELIDAHFGPVTQLAKCSCAFQGSIELDGDPEWRWDVAAVKNMQEIAVRSTDAGKCRSWFAISS